MYKRLLNIGICFMALWTLQPYIAIAWAPSFAQKTDFDKAMYFMKCFKNDSAIVIFNELICQLSREDSLNSPLGLKIQLRRGEALEKDDQDEEALRRLLQVAERSEEEAQWDVLAHCHLSLARLHEKMQRKSNCFQHLRQAESTIKKHGLASVYPRYAVRNSSYHRIFSDKDSAMHYAEEVLKTAPEFQLYDEMANGHMLKGMLLDRSKKEEIIWHYSQAGRHWKSVEDYSGYSFMMNNMSSLYARNNQPAKALAYNDSAIWASHKAKRIGHSVDYQYVFLQKRAKIFDALGQLDSALCYTQKGYQMELDYVNNLQHQKIIEIDAHYHDEKKAEQLKAQALHLERQQEKETGLVRLTAVVLLLGSLLAYYSFKLNKANQKTRQQAKTIVQTNQELASSLEQQIMLQGEMHHRVKNNLNVLIGLLELQREEIEDPKALRSLEAMSNRIYSIAAIHEMLHREKGTELINLQAYTETLCDHYSAFMEEKPAFSLNIDKRLFNVDTLMPLGIMLNEMISNSLKYARSLEEKLQIDIQLIPHADGYCMQYRDNGPGFPTGMLVEREGSLGTYLLKSMSRQLNGYMESKNDSGAVFNIFFKEKNREERILRREN